MASGHRHQRLKVLQWTACCLCKAILVITPPETPAVAAVALVVAGVVVASAVMGPNSAVEVVGVGVAAVANLAVPADDWG